MEVGKTVIIGASGGIGSELSRSLKASGQDLHLIAQDLSKLDKLASELDSTFSILDASCFSSLEKDFEVLSREGNSIVSVINCAGSVILKPAHLTSEEDYQDTIKRNLTTAFSAVRAGSKFINKGAIVLCSTAAVRIGLQNHEAIAAAKGGVEALVRSAAASYASKGIRVNAVAPGLTRTPMTEKIVNNLQALKISTGMHALGRIGDPKDIVSAISWLLDETQSWVTGQVLAIDGGLSTIVTRN